MARVFLSYRSSDTGAYSKLLARKLQDQFGYEAVFRDRDSIAPGINFVSEVRSQLSRCQVALVLVGPEWLTVKGQSGQLRLMEPNDFVRREVALALGLQLLVVPVLFDGAKMPRAEDLPEELRGLVFRNAYEINGRFFDRDADDLARKLEERLADAERTSMSPPIAVGRMGLLRQLLWTWSALSLIAVFTSVVPFFVPVVPANLWVFPATMGVAAFVWWLYWKGEMSRPPKARLI